MPAQVDAPLAGWHRAPVLPPAPSRRFLFLQGPTCAFFPATAAGLRALGHSCFRINLCLGDKLFWRGPGATDYRGKARDWPGFIAGFLDREAITDLVLLGEQRLYHRQAIAAAKARGVQVVVTDYGYIRPDWLILEREGLGAASLFPRDPAVILAQAASLPPIDFAQHYADSFPAQAAGDVAYHLANLLPWPFPHYRRFTLHHPVVNYLGTGWQLITRAAQTRAAAALLGRLRGQELYLYAMQMETDFSLRAYSRFADNDEALAAAIASFARGAAPGAHLVVKVHPLDPGLKQWPQRVARIAAGLGMAGRVHFLGGALHMDAVIDACRGVVTVNSTLAFRALQKGRPVLALGEAIYNLPGLAWQGEADGFWQGSTVPDPALVAAFIQGVAACLQVRGTGFRRPGLDAAIRNTVRRLHLGALNVPLAEVLA